MASWLVKFQVDVIKSCSFSIFHMFIDRFHHSKKYSGGGLFTALDFNEVNICPDSLGFFEVVCWKGGIWIPTAIMTGRCWLPEDLVLFMIASPWMSIMVTIIVSHINHWMGWVGATFVCVIRIGYFLSMLSFWETDVLAQDNMQSFIIILKHLRNMVRRLVSYQ